MKKRKRFRKKITHILKSKFCLPKRNFDLIKRKILI